MFVDPIGLLRVDLLMELVTATLLGGLIGLEREWSGKPAGLRTNILICVGAVLITDLSISISTAAVGNSQADASRLAAQIVSGIGFLGAGTIIQSRGTVSGLTSAATLWVVAAIGIAVGSGNLVEAVGTGVLVLLVLLPLGHVEQRLAGSRQSRVLILEVVRSITDLAPILEEARSCGLKVRDEEIQVEGDLLRIRLDMVGSAQAWTNCCAQLRAHPEIRALRFVL